MPAKVPHGSTMEPPLDRSCGSGMVEQLQVRLAELRSELATGQAELDRVERQRAYLRDTMLRIAGGIQVLEELLTSNGESEARLDGSQPGEAYVNEHGLDEGVARALE
jgi:hypothetical protein